MLLSALQKRPELPSEADLEEEARQLSATAKSEAMKGAPRHRWPSGATQLTSLTALHAPLWVRQLHTWGCSLLTRAGNSIDALAGDCGR